MAITTTNIVVGEATVGIGEAGTSFGAVTDVGATIDGVELSWEPDMVDIEVDQFGRPHISFDYNNTDNLGYMVLNGSAWDGRLVSTMDGIKFTSLELDSAERPYISFHSTKGDDDLYFTWLDDSTNTWRFRDSGLHHSDTIYDSSQWGRYNVLDLDQDDSVHIAFYDNAKTEILYYTDNYNPAIDTDGDGIPDSEDNFPSNPSETSDHDGDGEGDNADNDDDDDGVIDLMDDCQFGIIGAGADFDGDGCKDSEDDDDDNDGFDDGDDDCPKGMTGVGLDLDGDGCQDAEDSDIDGDGTPNDDDDFDRDPTEDTDSDDDGVGDNADEFDDDPTEDTDSDGDGVGDNGDAFPDDANETADNDGDGVGDNEDAFDDDANETTDSDGDGVGDNSDAFPDDANESSDLDGDGVGDNADTTWMETMFPMVMMRSLMTRMNGTTPTRME